MAKLNRILKSRVFPLCAVLAWEALAQGDFLQNRWPSIFRVVAELSRDWRNIVEATGATVWQVFQAAVIGVILGVPLGVFLAESKWRMGGGLYGSFAGLKAVPVTVLIPVFLTVFGLEQFVVPLVALPLVLNFCVNTAQAIAQVSHTRLRLLRSWSVSYSTYARHVLPFECLDSMLQTARVMLPFALALHVAVDYFLCIPNGLGCYVYQAYTYNDHARMYAAILVVGIIGLGLGEALDFTSRRLLGWKRDI